MAENAAKSNVWWPDMSVEQVPLFDEAAIKVGFSPSHPSPMGSVTNDYGFLLVHQRVEHQGLPSDATPQGLPSVSC